jgi:hypothetical protein
MCKMIMRQEMLQNNVIVDDINNYLNIDVLVELF